MEWEPGDKVEVESVADPELNAAVPSAAVPSLKVTLPVAAGSLTLAVKVTFAPTGAGLVSAVTEILVAPGPGAGTGAAATIPRHPVLREMRMKEIKTAITVLSAGCFREELPAMWSPRLVIGL
jgi:hypothetical protein